jgi:hypothetical protein
MHGIFSLFRLSKFPLGSLMYSIRECAALSMPVGHPGVDLAIPVVPDAKSLQTSEKSILTIQKQSSAAP